MAAFKIFRLVLGEIVIPVPKDKISPGFGAQCAAVKAISSSIKVAEQCGDDAPSLNNANVTKSKTPMQLALHGGHEFGKRQMKIMARR